MHPAIRTVEQGRGWGVSSVPIIDLVMKKTGKVWHVKHEPTVCGMKVGELPLIVSGVDPKAIFVAGHPVCARCLAGLGDVPMPTLLKDAS